MGHELPQGLKSIQHFAAWTPNAPAILTPDGETIAYKGLQTLVGNIGRRLAEAGIGNGDTVAVLAPHGLIQATAVIGVLGYCGCAPLQPRTTLEEIRTSLTRLPAAGLIVSPEFIEFADAAIEMGLIVVQADAEQSPDQWRIMRRDVRLESATRDSNAVLYLMTSATTGAPRIVPLSVSNLDAQTVPRCNSLHLAASDRQLLMTSFCHSLSIENAFAQFLAGGSVIITDGFESAPFRRWLEDLKPTWYDCAPAVHEAALVALAEGSPLDRTSLRFVQSAGGVLSRSTREAIERSLHVPVFNDYGMTEAGPIASDSFPGSPIPHGSAGRTRGLELGILDGAGEIHSDGTEGEIVLRGPAVFSGYLDDPAANERAFHNGWFRTGDSGRLDAEGNLFITGRIKEMINRGGEKISPAEVETVVRSHPAVLEAVAFSVPHPTLGEDVACAVVLRPERAVSVSVIELRHFAAEQLARFKVPRKIFFVDEIPKGELGKPQRWLLAEKLKTYRSQPPSPEDISVRILPYDVDDVFYGLHEIWARLLDRNDLGFNEDFFEAGGDSLAAINMLAEVDSRFGSQTSSAAASFLDEPTLENLTGLVGTARPQRPAGTASSGLQIYPVREEGTDTRIYCVSSDQEEGLYYRRLATHLHGEMDLFIVRPENTMYSRALFSIERAGEEMAELIRRAQPEGPYLFGGYCYGGIIAFEAARQLSLRGQQVRLILFDAPKPGSPSLWVYWRFLLGRAWRKLRKVENSGDPVSGTKGDSKRNAELLAKISTQNIQRLAWIAIIPFRRLLARFENHPIVERFLEWAQRDNFPCYLPHPSNIGILHFLSLDEPRVIEGLARFGWRKVARRGTEEHFLPLDHSNILHESNLPAIVNMIRKWRNE